MKYIHQLRKYMIMCLEKDKLNPCGRQKLTNIEPYILTYSLIYSLTHSLTHLLTYAMDQSPS